MYGYAGGYAGHDGRGIGHGGGCGCAGLSGCGCSGMGAGPDDGPRALLVLGGLALAMWAFLPWGK